MNHSILPFSGLLANLSQMGKHFLNSSYAWLEMDRLQREGNGHVVSDKVPRNAKVLGPYDAKTNSEENGRPGFTACGAFSAML